MPRPLQRLNLAPWQLLAHPSGPSGTQTVRGERRGRARHRHRSRKRLSLRCPGVFPDLKNESQLDCRLYTLVRINVLGTEADRDVAAVDTVVDVVRCPA